MGFQRKYRRGIRGFLRYLGSDEADPDEREEAHVDRRECHAPQAQEIP